MSSKKQNNNKRANNILFAAILNIGFTIVEIIGGLLTNSVAILSDALHDLGDSVALVTSYAAERQSNRPADKKRTFGYARFSLFSAVFNAVVLIVGSVFILIEALKRFTDPEPVQALGMIGIAVFGVAVNTFAYWRLRKGASANEGMLSWHLLEDVIGWVAVLVGAAVIYITDFYIIDSILTVGYTLFILYGVLKSLTEVGNILLQGVPNHISIQNIKGDLLSIQGVVDVHDIHVWSLEGETDVFSGHVVISDDVFEDSESIKEQIKERLVRHHIEHSTLEIERVGSCNGMECGLGVNTHPDHLLK